MNTDEPYNSSLDAAEDYQDQIDTLLAEVKRLREERDEIIEYVDCLTATPHVLRKLMGSPSQVHTIDNLALSLDRLLERLREEGWFCKEGDDE